MKPQITIVILKNQGGKTTMVSVMQGALIAIVGTLGIVIFSFVKDALNTDLISTSANSLINLVDLILAAILILGLVVAGLSFTGT